MFVLFLFGTFLMQGQENKLLKQISQFNDGITQVKYIFNLKVDSIPEDGFSKLLKIKLNSNLDNLGDVFAFYADGKELELSRKELSVLEDRVRYFADWFVKNEPYCRLFCKASASTRAFNHADCTIYATSSWNRRRSLCN